MAMCDERWAGPDLRCAVTAMIDGEQRTCVWEPAHQGAREGLHFDDRIWLEPEYLAAIRSAPQHTRSDPQLPRRERRSPSAST
jgi:hypothetical protein